MVTHFASKKTVVSVAALLLIGGTIVLTQPFATTATRATVCVKRDGQLRMLTGGATGCGQSEQLVQWVVDGEVTDLGVGPGLIASREGGLVNLALDPSILECEKCNDGKVFAGFNDGPRHIPMGDPPAHEPLQIATLDLPEGAYAIFAKMLLFNNQSFYDVRVVCRLVAGADSDEAHVVLEKSYDDGALLSGASRHVMKLQLVHRFDSPGAVVLSCADGFSSPAAGEFDGTAQFSHLKIIAMKASSISNVVLLDQ